jgi:thymidylate synthase
MNGETGTVFTDLLEINVLELSKLPAEPDGTALWNWGRFLKCESEEEFAMIAEKDPEVKEAVATLMELSEDERNQMLADARFMKEWDEWALRKEQYEKGYQRAKEDADKFGA